MECNTIWDRMMMSAYLDGRDDRERGCPARTDQRLADDAVRRSQGLLADASAADGAMLIALREEYNVGRMAAQWSADAG